MGRQSKTFNKETHVESSGKMKLMCLAILLLGLSCLVESQLVTPSPQEMCANSMEFFMDLGWVGPTDYAPCPYPNGRLWYNMLDRWDADGNGCLSAEEFARMWEDLGLWGQDFVDRIFKKMDNDGDGCLEFIEWKLFVRRVCNKCGSFFTQG